MLPSMSDDDCDSCKPSRLVRRSLDSVAPSTIVLSCIPFILTWIATVYVAQYKLFPLLASNEGGAQDGLPQFSKDSFKPATNGWKEKLRSPSRERIASWVFSASIGLSAVLIELLLFEIADTLNPAARGLALKVTLSSLLILILVVTPALEIHGFVKRLVGASTDTVSTRAKRPWLQHFLRSAIFKLWLLAFWYIPQASILRDTLHHPETGHNESDHGFSEACLERVGIIGISLMASLAGFAAVSSLWQTFGVRHRPVKETDISRKASGLAATEDMLANKQSRVRALERKMSADASKSEQKSGFVGRMMGSFRGSNEAQELKALRMEVSGLETMRFTLSTSLSNLRSRYADQERSKTRYGRAINILNIAFAIYCAYRIFATSLSSLRKWWQPTHSFATSDPINKALALVTAHWDSELDRDAWARQISFFLSGIMLLASFNAVLQTLRLFSRFAPSLLQKSQTSLPLIISQIAGTYVISSALLLRSNLPAEVSSVISEALGAPLEGRFVEGWFESWFLVAVGLTATGILIGRKVGGDSDWDDDEAYEMGKRS
ncbi:Putative The Golgi pH regulator/GPCR-type G protein [Septoria linicola]|uniref:The Golgi pH regulator/GPCR-type G protein n=1 Tax=Septoria linicola TaxID=215465 RepID=A0A9Q9AUJ5_9PEZI|nr:putative The Golgi pH regulator/GPCR-type G protein [Septoria linicola]USW55400.1 Putative The Golgi pH regulator/GPCR-type G protein [Septoria linicola]